MRVGLVNVHGLHECLTNRLPGDQSYSSRNT
jgi:hypothetical protein